MRGAAMTACLPPKRRWGLRYGKLWRPCAVGDVPFPVVLAVLGWAAWLGPGTALGALAWVVGVGTSWIFVGWAEHVLHWRHLHTGTYAEAKRREALLVASYKA